jgi:hypothetical protein
MGYELTPRSRRRLMAPLGELLPTVVKSIEYLHGGKVLQPPPPHDLRHVARGIGHGRQDRFAPLDQPGLPLGLERCQQCRP